jgi:hypothetical protein
MMGFNESQAYSFNNDKNTIESIVFPDYIETRFGVELETCIRVQPDCIDPSTNENINLRALSFQKKFDMYFKSILAPYCVSNPTFAAKYKFVALNTSYDDGNDTRYKSYIYSLTEPFLTSGEINFHESTLAEKELIRSYSIPIFEEDSTIECGDSLMENPNDPNVNNTKNFPYNENMGAIIKKNKSFSIECITPILSISGQVTYDKVMEAINEMLSFYGLSNPSCFIPNFSTGFHVNISLFDTRTNMPVNITYKKFYAHLLEIFTKYEENVYNSVRSRKPVTYRGDLKPTWQTIWAEPLSPVYNRLKQFADNMIETHVKDLPANTKNKMKKYVLRELLLIHESNNDNTNVSQFQPFIRTFLRGQMENIDRLSGKTRSIKKKGPHLLEFRLFQSERDISLLAKYIFDVIKIVQDTHKYLSIHTLPKSTVSIEEINNSENSSGTGGGSGTGRRTRFGSNIEELNGGYRHRKTLSKKLKKSHRKRYTKRRR